MSMLQVHIQDSIAILRLNHPTDKVNTLNESMIEEFYEFFDKLNEDQNLIGAIITSGKEDNFIAGADIDMFKERESAEDLEELSRTGHSVFNRIESCRKPIVAAIHGSCMGGGLELSMACHYRVATSHKKTVFALPEVKLGVIPGTGGTQRLPRLIGIQKALTCMLTGKNIYARQSKRMGLVDELVHEHALMTAAIKSVNRIHEEGKPKRKLKLSFTEKLLEGNAVGRTILFSQARKKTLRQTRGNYPALAKIIDAVQYGYKHGHIEGLMHESKLFGECGVSKESRALVNLFFAMTDAKKNPLQDQVRQVKNIGVLGAGLMGSGIADVSISKDYHVYLKDRDIQSAAKGAKGIWDDLEKKRKKRIISSFERDQISSKVSPTGDYKAFIKVDLVIEAVFEDLELKKKILAETESSTPDHCIFATNTSSLPISEIAADARRPEQVLGMHYFSPVQKMPLLEIITTDKTADWVTATAYDVGVKQGKTVIVVNDGPGFYTTRILAPYMNEALLLLEDGASIKYLDDIMKDFGFPVGPMALLDEVGIDVGAHVGDTMKPLFETRNPGSRSSTKAHELMEAGFLGRKNEKGLYRYDTKKKEVNLEAYSYFKGDDRQNPRRESAQLRMALMMVNEAVYCLQEGIIKTPVDGDLGALLGLGFPPFTGGPFRYIDQIGAEWVRHHLEEFTRDLGPRFTPAPLLVDYAKGKKKFYWEG